VLRWSVVGISLTIPLILLFARLLGLHGMPTGRCRDPGYVPCMRINMLVIGLFLVAAPALAQRPEPRAGEVLTYKVHSARFGDIGTAVMRVDHEQVAGRDAFRLSFDFSARITLFKVSDQTRSWIDVETGNTLRYSKKERSPVTDRDEWVEILPTGMWATKKAEYALGSNAPLDELAFIYLVRVMADSEIKSLELNRHFDAARNPVSVKMLGYEMIKTQSGPARAMVVQMDVKDPRQKSGKSRLRFYISDDEARLPLRIDSSMPVAGALTMSLKSVTVDPLARR